MYHGLGTDGRNVDLIAVEGSNFDERQVGVTGGDSLEGQGRYPSLPRDSCSVRRPRSSNGDQAVALIPMDDGDRLSVTPEEVPRVNVDELQDRGIELKLNRHREDVSGVVEVDGDREGAADSLVSGGRNDREAYGRTGWLSRRLVSGGRRLVSGYWRSGWSSLLLQLLHCSVGRVGCAGGLADSRGRTRVDWSEIFLR